MKKNLLVTPLTGLSQFKLISKIFTLSFCIALSFCVDAQELKWEWLNPSVNGNRLNGVSVISHGSGIAVSYDSLIRISHDNGTLWTSLPIAYRPYKVFTPSSSLSFATTKDGEIVKNIFAGSIKTVFKKSALNCFFSDLQIDSVSGVGLAYGGYEVDVPMGGGGYTIYLWSLIVRTTDFGETWSTVYEAEGDRLYKGFPHQGGYTAFGMDRWNFAVESTDGITWAANPNFGGSKKHAINGLGFLNDTLGLLSYTDIDTVFITRNGGKNWQPHFRKYLNGINVSGSTVFGLKYDSILFSNDLGVSWNSRSVSLPGLGIEDYAVADKTIIAADGVNGIYFAKGDDYNFKLVNKSLDYQVGPGGYFAITNQQAVFTSPQVGYIPFYSSLYKTTDGGCHWRKLPDLSFNEYVWPGFTFINDTLGYAMVGSSTLGTTGFYKTINGGETWSLIGGPSESAGVGQLIIFSPSVMVIMDQDNSVFRTTDGGKTWTMISEGSGGPGPGKPFVINENKAVIRAAYDQIRITTNGGASWSYQVVGFGIDWKGIYFSDEQHGLMVGSGYDLATSTDKWYLVSTSNGGTSWTKVRDLPQSPKGIKFIDPLNGFIWGSNGMLLKTTDAGANWEPVKTIMANDIYDLFQFGNQIFMTGENYSIIKTTTDVPKAAFNLPLKVYCAGDSLVAVDQSEQSVSYLWSVDGEVLSSSETPHIKLVSPGLHQIALTSGTCNFTYYSTIVDSVTVNPVPAKPIILINDKVKHGLVKLCDSTYNITTQLFNRYKWSNTDTIANFVLGNEQSLSLVVKNEFNCSSFSDTLQFTHVPLPTASFDIAYAAHPTGINFINNSTNADSYDWLLSDSTTSTMANWSHTFKTSTADFTATLIAKNYCGQDSLTKAYIVLGIKESATANNKIYPNPCRASETIYISGEPIEKYSIQTITGSTVVNQIQASNSSIDLPPLLPGLYLIILYTNQGESIIHKLVVN